ncbi:hypothetical protein JAAARDRAFT_132825 [Jaapia argillacea MUCL 33604]|uniref:non-specific serine/threonine protein kinase n=1 Tax=Jaapia argillacea MUCL 33604 TaxID=933084 RepID=A0A067PNM5_9AGAM|nr:hypothetical protein JAAARDRAFT_132825 [Jaapia argillacea MUCL 33604]
MDQPDRTAHSEHQNVSESTRTIRDSNTQAGRHSLRDYEFGDILGEGSYSTVYRAHSLVSTHEYAIKVVDKSHLRRNNKVHTAMAEKNTLIRLGSDHPGIARLHTTFQDEWSLYFVLDYCPNGSLHSHLTRLGSFSLHCTQFYAAQIIDAVAYIHSKGVVHRDLKPENLLLDKHMRIKIADFGTAKILQGTSQTKTFVGTPQYQPPELLESGTMCPASDLWAIGCIIYQLLSGSFPFCDITDYLTWQRIKALDYTIPTDLPPTAADLISRILVREPEGRLGAGADGSGHGMKDLREHGFFEGIKWDELWSGEVPLLEHGLICREELGCRQDQDGGFGDPVEDFEFDWANGEGSEDSLIRGQKLDGDNWGTRRSQDEIEWANPNFLAEHDLGKLRPQGESGFGRGDHRNDHDSPTELDGLESYAFPAIPKSCGEIR